MPRRSQNQVLQLDLNNEIHRKILNVVAKGIIKLSGNTFNKAITERNSHEEITEEDKNSGRKALLEALKRFDEAVNKYYQDLLSYNADNAKLEEEVSTVRDEVHISVRATLKPNGETVNLHGIREAKFITDQARELLKTNPDHPHLDWNYILQPDSPQKNPQPKDTPSITPSQKGFFDITPSTANRIGMFGISVFIFEIALALCSSALNTPTGEQVAIFTSNPMFIVVNAIAFAATAFYKAIPETSSGIPNL
jgi:hypothetical protein